MCPLSVTPQAIRPKKLNFRKSLLLTEEDFISLLTPHTPRLLYPDAVSTRKPAIYPLFLIDPSSSTHLASLDHEFGFVFTPCLTNSVYALLTRILMPLPNPVPKTLPSYILRFFYSYPPCVTAPDNYQRYKDTWKPHNRERLQRAEDDLKESLSLPSNTDLFCKSDELLIDKMKPRVIWGVHPKYQVLIGPHVMRMTEYYSLLFDGFRIHYFEGKKFTLCFACGMVAEDLDKWLEYNLELLYAGQIDFCGIFLGDDSLILKIVDGVLTAIENDFEKFDRSQEEACVDFVQSIYKHNAVDFFSLEARLAMFNTKLRIKYGKNREFSFSIALPHPQQPTGQPGTCLDNTLLNISSTVHVQLGGTYSDFGFYAKTKTLPFTQATFLRGFWCKGSDDKYHWNYLPSVCIKLLKSLTRPEKLFPFSLDPLKACANAMFSSVGLSQTPLIRIGVRRFASGLKPIEKKMTISRSSDSVPLDPSYLATFLITRYGLEGFWMIMDLEKKFETATLGGDLTHPAWKILAVDYS